MAVTLDCPTCGKPRTYLAVPESGCPHCEAPYPPELLRHGEAHLARQAAPRPVPLTFGMYASTALGVLFLLGMVCAGLDVGTFAIDNELVSGPEFLRRAGFPFVLIGILSLSIGYAMWRERWWSRQLVLVFWVVANGLGVIFALQAGIPIGSVVPRAAMGLAVILGPTAAYFFLKDNVVAYYNALRMERDASHRN